MTFDRKKTILFIVFLLVITGSIITGKFLAKSAVFFYEPVTQLFEGVRLFKILPWITMHSSPCSFLSSSPISWILRRRSLSDICSHPDSISYYPVFFRCTFRVTYSSGYLTSKEQNIVDIFLPDDFCNYSPDILFTNEELPDSF